MNFTLTAEDAELALTFITASPAGRVRVLRQAVADETGRLSAGLLHALLSAYAVAAQQLRTRLGWLALQVAIAEVARVGQDLDCRTAASLIASHAQAADVPGVDADLRDLGAIAFNETVDFIDGTGRYAQVTTSVVAVWQRLLPELTTEAGRLLLRHIASEIIESD